MSQHKRQTLAAYAFFEDARKGSNYTEDALVPFVLPAIAGRDRELFDPAALAKELEPLFGPELVLALAESLVEALSRQGYIRQEVRTDEGAVYVYTDKTLTIPVDDSVSRAEGDIDLLVAALEEYISATHSINPVTESPEQLRARLIDWLTTSDTIITEEGLGRQGSQPSSGAPAGQLAILFSAFVSWLSRDRPALFEKAVTFVELGLVIDLVSEIRVPTRTPKKIDVSVVLDTSILLELLGLCGPVAQRGAQRLADLCREHNVPLVTMAHLVDEVREITFNVVQNTDPYFRGSVNDAVNNYPSVRELLNKVHKNPDSCIRGVGVKIVPYTQVHDRRALEAFNDEDIERFAAELPYEQSKRRRAERDAWSLAYAVRRQNGSYSSSLYDSKCVVVTRSPPFVSVARRFLRDVKRYPNYAMTPVIELRHFSTLFMLAFGSDATGKVVRAELVSSCDRIVRASPNLIAKIRSVLARLKVLTDEQIDAALCDPVTLAEFALVTGNDPSVVTPQNGPALLAVVRESTIKEETLRNKARELQQRQEFARELAQKDAEVERAKALAAEAQQAADERAATNQSLNAEVEQQASVVAALLAQQIQDRVRRIWFLPIALAVTLGGVLTLDAVKEFLGVSRGAQIAMVFPLGALFFYSTLALVVPEMAPAVLRGWLTKHIAARTLSPYPESTRERVMALVSAFTKSAYHGAASEQVGSSTDRHPH